MTITSHNGYNTAIKDTILPGVKIDFREVTVGSSIELTIDNIVQKFVAGTDFSIDVDINNTANNFYNAVTSYLTAQTQTDHYNVVNTNNIVSLQSTRSGEQYSFFAKINNISLINSSYSQDAGGGAKVQTFNYVASTNCIFVVDFYPSGNPDKIELQINDIKKTESSMLSNPPPPFYSGGDIYLRGTYTAPSTTWTNILIHEAVYNEFFIGDDKGLIPTRINKFVLETGITDLIQPTSIIYNSLPYRAPQRLWVNALQNDNIKIRVVGGTEKTGYAFKAYEIHSELNDIRITDISDKNLTLSAREVEIIAEKVTIKNLNGYYTENEANALLDAKANIVHNHTIELPFSYTIAGLINIASGQDDYIIDFPATPGRLTKIIHKVGIGNVDFQILINNTVVDGFGKISATTKKQIKLPSTEIVLNGSEMISVLIIAVESIPENLGIHLIINCDI